MLITFKDSKSAACIYHVILFKLFLFKNRFTTCKDDAVTLKVKDKNETNS